MTALEESTGVLRGRGLPLSKAKGGRHTPFFTGYLPQFFFRTMETGSRFAFWEGGKTVGSGVVTEVMTQ